MNWPIAIRELTIAHPGALLLLAAVAIVAAWWFTQADSPRRAVAPTMRALALALFVLALADPQTVMRFEGATRPALLDLSNSITAAMRGFDANLLAEHLKLRTSDPAILFGADSTSANVGDALSILKTGGGCKDCRPEATDLEAALSRLASDPDAAGGPAVLVTDGWQNRGDADNVVGALVAARIALYIFTPPGAEATADVAMTELVLPKALSKAEPFALGVTMANLNAIPASGTIQIYENNRLTDERPVTIPPGQQRFDFPVRSESTGLISYKAVFTPGDPSLDIYRENDSLEGWVGIGARRRTLIIADRAKDASYLETIVRRLGLEPTVVALEGRQFTGGPSGYDAVILDNVSHARLSPDSERALASYVEHGGSLAMVGGDESFGLGGYAGSEIANVMPVAMKPPEHREQRHALVLIIDTSGSMMRQHKIDYARAAAKTVTKALKDDDLVEVIGFASLATQFIPLQPLKESRPYFDQVIDRMRPGGQTYLLPPLKQAERDLASSRASLKHVIILTDGKTGGETPEQYYDLVSSMHREGGVTISSIAIGNDADLRFLTEISKYGGGGLYQTNSPETLPEIFLEDVRKHGGELTMVEQQFSPIAPSPDPVMKDLAGRRLPPLKGYVSTQLKPRATMDLFVDRDGAREPVVASWKVGSGKALAVTTDANGRWSAPWITTGTFGQVWDRLLSWMTPEGAPEQNYDVALGYHSGRLDLKLTDYSEHPERSARLVSAVVTGPDNARSEVILSEDAPGELSGSVEAHKPGTYYIALKSAPGAKDQSFPPLAYTVSPAAFAEIPRPAPNYDLLEHLASATGGRLNPPPSELALSRPTIEQRASLAAWPIVLAMLLLIGEALVRRLTL